MKDGTSENKCPRCGGNTDSKKSGSITQWVANCACTTVDIPQEDTELEICTTCKKRISAGRAGSLTQWIFRSDLCSCAMPAVEKSRMALAAENAAASSASDTALPHEEELKVDPERFPLQRYAPLVILGSGMAGTVYLCNDRLLKKKVAIKLLATLTAEQLVAFQGEARAASKLNHPNVVKVMDFGVTTGGVPFMVMEFVNGDDLAGILEQEGTISVTAALYIFGKVCDGLAEAHKQNIFHRDVKNSNILVGALESHQPDVRLIDFGVASVRPVTDSQTAQGATLVGTPAYMSPDQALGKPYDARCEVYSLGCALFEALAGSPPFTAETALEIINKHAHEKPPRLTDLNPDVDFSEQLEKVVAKCLAKKPGDRYQSMEELSRELTAVALNDLAEPSVAREPESTKAEAPPAKNNLLIAAFAVVAVILVASIWAVVSQVFPSSNSTTRPSPSEEVSIPLEHLEGGELQAPLIPLDANHFVRRKYNGINYLISSGELTDSDIAEVSSQQDLEGVYILSENVTGEGLAAVIPAPLKYLDINNTPLTDKGFDAISKIKSLKSLALGDLNISAAQMEMLTKLPALEKLDLANSHPSESAIAKLAAFPTIDTLILSNVQATKAADLAVLASDTNLKTLDLSYIKFGAQDLAPLEKLVGLTKVSFTGSDIDDRALPHVAKLPLNAVSLDRTRVTGNGIQALASLHGLKKLSLRGCEKVGGEAIAKLGQALPDCTIVR